MKEKNNEEKFDVVRVSTNSEVNKIAGAIVAVFNEKGHADVQAVGAGATNQAVKALIIAKSIIAKEYLKETAVIPTFVNIVDTRKSESGSDLISAIRFRLIEIKITGGEYEGSKENI